MRKMLQTWTQSEIIRGNAVGADIGELEPGDKKEKFLTRNEVKLSIHCEEPKGRNFSKETDN